MRATAIRAGVPVVVLIMCALSVMLHDANKRKEGMDAGPSAAIVNGEEVEWRDYRFYCLVRKKGKDASHFFPKGSGVLIKPRYVLTCAHVVDDMRPDQLSVTFEHKNIDVEAFFVHPLYHEGSNKQYDIAILKLKQPSAAAPLLFSDRPLRTNEQVFVVGKGKVAPGDDTPAIKRKLRRAVVSFEKETPGVGLHFISRGSHPEGGCGGDSGSPMFIGKPGAFRLVSLHAASPPDSGPNCMPVKENGELVYRSVGASLMSSYTPLWIAQIIGKP
jgi:hypothetical protein